jgi:hypothetical protein
MDANLAAGPLMHRSPSEPLSVSQTAEDALDLLLAGVAGHESLGSLIRKVQFKVASSFVAYPQVKRKSVNRKNRMQADCCPDLRFVELQSIGGPAVA